MICATDSFLKLPGLSFADLCYMNIRLRILFTSLCVSWCHRNVVDFCLVTLFIDSSMITGSLAVGSTVTAPLTIDFNDTTQSAQFDLCTSLCKYPVSITAPVGELLRPHTLNEKEFITLQSEFIFATRRYFYHATLC